MKNCNIRIGSDSDIGLNRNSSDWLGMNSYPILSPGQIFLGWKKNKTDFVCEICGKLLSPDEKKFNPIFPNHSGPIQMKPNQVLNQNHSDFGYILIKNSV